MASILLTPDIKTHHIYLSTKNANLTWQISDVMRNVAPNVLCLNSPIENVIAVQLLNFSYTIRNATPVNRVNILIEELSASSFVANNSRFHFTGIQTSSSNTIVNYSTYYCNHGIYNFNQPIQRLDSLTLKLFTQYGNLELDQAVIKVSIAAVGANIEIDFGTIPHGMYEPNAMLTFIGQVTNDANINSVLNAGVIISNIVNAYKVIVPVSLIGVTYTSIVYVQRDVLFDAKILIYCI